MPLTTTFAGLSARALGFGSSGYGYIFDNFLRNTTGALGNAVTGQTWVADTGVWFCNGSAAQTTPLAIAVIPFKANATITLTDLTNGAGVVFWYQDANNFWQTTTRLINTGFGYDTQLLIEQTIGGTEGASYAFQAGALGGPVEQALSMQVVTEGDFVTVTVYGSATIGVDPLSGGPFTNSSAASLTGTGVGIVMIDGPYGTQGTTVGPFTAI